MRSLYLGGVRLEHGSRCRWLVPDHAIEPIFIRRWSPRAMSGKPLAEAELMRLFEAARWAPSTDNEQEWRFLYAHRDTEHWTKFFALLAEPNQASAAAMTFTDPSPIPTGISRRTVSPRQGRWTQCSSILPGLAADALRRARGLGRY